MGMGGTRKSGDVTADINVTPLCDIMLVLLIIFMVVTPMLSSGVDVRLPKARSTHQTQDVGQHLVVSIREDGAVFVDTKRSSEDDLIDDINRGYREDPARSLLVKGDRNLRWKDVRGIMEIINEGGMHTMLLATEKAKD